MVLEKIKKVLKKNYSSSVKCIGVYFCKELII